MAFRPFSACWPLHWSLTVADRFDDLAAFVCGPTPEADGQTLCGECGEQLAVYAPQQHPAYDGWAAGYGATWEALCVPCWAKAKRAVEDGPSDRDLDGEAFRGGEAMAYLAEQQAAARRVK